MIVRALDVGGYQCGCIRLHDSYGYELVLNNGDYADLDFNARS